jgi:hypothetical protein
MAKATSKAGYGSGWHNESLRHSNARKTGHAGGTYSHVVNFVSKPYGDSSKMRFRASEVAYSKRDANEWKKVLEKDKNVDHNYPITIDKSVVDVRKLKNDEITKPNKVITSIYFGANGARVGGYSFYAPEDEKMKGNADFVPWAELIQEAEDQNIKWVYLAGNWGMNPQFSKYGHRGLGERVRLEEMKKILKQDEGN